MERCIDSILMQTNLTWNLILVDDESMDGNGNLCDSYAKKKYSNITSIHKLNGGKSLVRNAGIDNSDNVVHYGCRFRRLGTVGFTRKVI